jgi:hypothetical protein
MLVGARQLETLVMIQTKFDLNWSGSFRGEDFFKSFTTYDDDDGRRKAFKKIP